MRGRTSTERDIEDYGRRPAVLQVNARRSLPSVGYDVGSLYADQMLKNFLYLNDDALGSYLSALEGGARSSVQQRTARSSGVQGGVDARILNAKGDRAAEDETTIDLADTAHARYERLEQHALDDPERAGWITVLSPDVDLDGVGIGAIIDIECEIYVPHIIKALSASGGLSEALDAFNALLPVAGALGLDTSGGPDTTQVAAIRSIAGSLGGDQVVVGERDDTEWRVAGRLLTPHLRGEVDGVARVVGKVATIWKAGRWKPLLALPGMSLLPRDQRRALERQQPSEDQAENWLEGPAAMLDILAIYR